MDENIKRFVLEWNYRYPVDRWWREKHKVAFNSPTHRISNFWDQMFEYEEDVLYSELNEKNEYKRNQNDWLTIHDVEETIHDSAVNALEEISKYKKYLNSL